MAFEEMTLVVFTTLAPAGIVATVLIACFLFCTPAAERADVLGHHLVIPLGVAVIGLVASAAHLGTPANVLYVVTGIGRSPLSNEVAAAVVFFVLGGVYWIVSFVEGVPLLLRRVWLAVLALAGIVALVFIGLAYAVPTIPTWDMAQVPFALVAGGVVSGPPLVLFTMSYARAYPSLRFRRLLLVLALIGLIASVVLFAGEYALLSGIQTTASYALDLVPLWLPATALFAVLGAASVVLVSRACRHLPDAHVARRQRRWALLLSGAAALCCLVACFIMRFCFYSMYMTIGV